MNRTEWRAKRRTKEKWNKQRKKYEKSYSVQFYVQLANILIWTLVLAKVAIYMVSDLFTSIFFFFLLLLLLLLLALLIVVVSFFIKMLSYAYSEHCVSHSPYRLFFLLTFFSSVSLWYFALAIFLCPDFVSLIAYSRYIYFLGSFFKQVKRHCTQNFEEKISYSVYEWECAYKGIIIIILFLYHKLDKA